MPFGVVRLSVTILNEKKDVAIRAVIKNTFGIIEVRVYNIPFVFSKYIILEYILPIVNDLKISIVILNPQPH